MKPYKTKNKRIIQRGTDGRFRQTTLADIGMAVCKICGAIFTPDLSKFKDQTFIDPRDLREAMSVEICPKCKEK